MDTRRREAAEKSRLRHAAGEKIAKSGHKVRKGERRGASRIDTDADDIRKEIRSSGKARVQILL